MTRATNAAGTVTRQYLYTADGERLATLSPGRELWTLRGPDNQVLRDLEHLSTGWNWVEDYVYRGSGLLASISNTGNPATSERHYHLDHLGSPRLVTDSGQQVVARHVLAPYGEELTAANQDELRLKFTGHERDELDLGGSEGDLDYMHARFCSPQLGRFASVDPANSHEATQPQSWNRYAYASANPMLRVDPNGKKDRRTKQDRAILEDPDILAAVAAILERTGLDRPLQERQEVGAVFANLGNGDYDIDGGLVTDHRLNSVNLQLGRTEGGDIVTISGKELAGTMHSHPGSGPVKIDGKSLTLLGGSASAKDREGAKITGRPSYILNSTTSMLKVESVNGKVVLTRILTRKDYKDYLERARQAQKPPTK